MGDIEATRWQRLRTLLERALDLDAGARSAWLDGLGGDDAALGIELRQLLAQYEDLRDRTLSTAMVLLAIALAKEGATH